MYSTGRWDSPLRGKKLVQPMRHTSLKQKITIKPHLSPNDFNAKHELIFLVGCCHKVTGSISDPDIVIPLEWAIILNPSCAGFYLIYFLSERKIVTAES